MVLIGLSCSPLFAQTKHAKKFTVDIRISGDKDIQADLRSFIARELRSLGDVEVVDNFVVGGLGINVVAFADSTTSGKSLGYSVSLTVVEHLICSGKTYHDFVTGFLYGGGKDDLRRIAQSIGTDVDTKILDDRR